jgi:DNA replication protein DnaC
MIRGVAMGAVFSGDGFDTFKTTQGNSAALEACKRVAAGGDKGVVMIGSNGRGKSHLLESLAREFDKIHSRVPVQEEVAAEDFVEVPPLRELMDMQFEEDAPDYSPYLGENEVARHAHVEFWPALDLVAALRKDALDDEGDLVKRCMTCDLLLLDDIGREKMSDFIAQEFHRIIDYRYRQMLPLAVATNLTRAQITERYGAHTMSRFAAMCDVVDISGKDYRLNGGA